MRTMILLAGACLIGGTVEAQGTVERRRATAEEQRRAERAATVMRDGVMQRFMVDDSAAMNRATLGVTLGGAAHKRDTLGVFVEAVAEDGPAERAGVYEGHRIAFINGVDVRASAADAGDAYLSGVGQHRLVRAMQSVTPGSTVTLRVWTGSGYRDAQVTTGRFADVYKNQRFGGMFGDGTPSGFGFSPAMEGLRMTVPPMREFYPQPSREVRIESRPGQPDNVTELRPAEASHPKVRTRIIESTPRAISIPRIAPTTTGRRRYTI